MRHQILAGILLLGAVACGDDRPPTAPKPIITESADSIIRISVDIPGVRGLERNTVGIGLDAFPRAIATRADGTTVDVTQLAAWDSSDTTIVNIERQRFPVGVSIGTALLTASYRGVTGSQLVRTRKCISWQLSGPSMTWLGQSVEFIASAYDACSIHWSQVSPAWSTSNPAVAALEPSNGWPPRVTVVGRNPGVAVITATVSGNSVEPLERTASITVLSSRRPPPEFLWFNINDPLLLGDSGRLEGEARWFDPIEWREDVAENGYWKSSDRSVVVITPKGEFTARGVGTVIISVEFEGARRDISTRVVRP